jgi:hypothetical protein
MMGIDIGIVIDGPMRGIDIDIVIDGPMGGIASTMSFLQ